MAIRADRVGVREDQVDIHGRVTSPSFLNELLEDLPEWTDMPVWVNGTEEVLPSNNSVPVTSPILADIAYPDIRRDNQYFTYRESPTPVDGLAKIKSIKGNTLVWNQLMSLIISTTTTSGITYDVSNGEFTINGTATATMITNLNNDIAFKANHKYLIRGIPSTTTAETHRIDIRTASQVLLNTIQNNYLWVPTQDVDAHLTIRIQTGTVVNNVKYSLQIFDLTEMGLETADQFNALFSLPYYDYNAGTLLSFNGTGIKTVGKNIFSTEGNTWYKNNVSEWNSTYDTSSTRIRSMGFPCKKGTYTISGFPTSNNISLLSVLCYDINHNYLGNATRNGNTFVISFDECEYIALLFSGINFDSSTNALFKNADIQVELGSFASSYEPYISHITNLPISTYFPTGMKSAGTVYDELTPRKGITRIGAVDLGSLDWIHRTEIGEGIFSCDVTSTVLYKRQPSVNFEVAQYNNGGTVTGVVAMVEEPDMTVCVYHTGNTDSRFIYIKNTTYSDATALKTSLSGVYLFYELATPVELPTMSFE